MAWRLLETVATFCWLKSRSRSEEPYITQLADSFSLRDTPSPTISHHRVGSSNKWTRVLLKVSGEALAGENGFGIDPDVVQKIARQVAEASLAGVQVAVVVGGGNFFRGAQHEGKGLDRASADYMG